MTFHLFSEFKDFIAKYNKKLNKGCINFRSENIYNIKNSNLKPGSVYLHDSMMHFIYKNNNKDGKILNSLSIDLENFNEIKKNKLDNFIYSDGDFSTSCIGVIEETQQKMFMLKSDYVSFAFIV